MAAKARQSMQSVINDTFAAGSAERKAFTLLLTGIDTNKNNPEASITSKKTNWEKLADTLREQWGRK